MNRQQIAVVLLGVALSAPAPIAGAEAKALSAQGTVEAVTVYRGQALVRRVVEVDAPVGAVDLVVTELPAQIVPGSLYADGDDGVRIRAVRFRTRAVREEPRAEVRRLDAQIEQLNETLRENHVLQTVEAKKEAYLGSIEKFSSGKVKDEMTKGTLKVEAITSLTEFLFAQRSGIAKKTLALKEAQRALHQKLSLLQRRRGELTRGSSRTAREAVVFLDKLRAGKTAIRLSYLVRGASWSPAYNLRSAGRNRQVSLEYNALVQQMSGEDWKGVKLTLSTASPTMVAESPILAPLWIALTPRPAPKKKDAGWVYRGQRTAGANLKKALAQRDPRQKRSGFEQDWDVNVWANRLQITDLTARRDLLLAGRDLAMSDESISVNYALDGRISIPSRSDQQMIQIAALKLQGSFYYQAVPLLTSYVYQQADIVNTSDVALLSGPVNSYLDGQFMGSGRIPMVAKGQRFTAGFGVDSQLRATRELADKTERIQGGNRELTFRYRLLIDNYKDKPVTVRLLDRLPDPRGADIRITLGKLKDPLSDDKLYLRTIRKMGILRWKVEVPAKVSGASARAVVYEFTMEFDRKMHIGELSAAEVERQKKEFQIQLMMQQ